MCKVMGKIMCKIFGTIALTIVFGIGVWICFDVYTVTDHYTYEKFKNGADNYTASITDFQYVEGTVKSDLFHIPIHKGYYYYDLTSKCYFDSKDQIGLVKYYPVVDDNEPKIYINTVENDQNVEKRVNIDCIQASFLDKKGFYFEGVTTTVFWIGICGCVLYVVCLLCTWFCCWKSKKGQDYVTVTYQN